jgi:long-chain fatty acid transport protein
MDKRGAFMFAAVATLASAPALGSGFAFYEQGAKASGQAGAWVARADDASANWYNPAALVHTTGREIQVGVNYIDSGSDTSFSPAPGLALDAVSNVSTPAQIYFSHKINDRVAWGVGLNTPFGLVTEWDDVPLTLAARRSELATYLLNPNVAFAVHKYWSFGVGIDYLFAEVKDFSRDTTVVVPTTANLRGDGDGFGYNAALQFKSDCLAVAAQYRSGMSTDIEGSLTFSGPPGNLLNSSASAKVELPSQTMVGVAWISKRFDVEASAYHTAWNVFETLEIVTPNPLTSVTFVENWEATWAYRLGAAFRLGNELRHEVRLGGVLDETPIPAEFLRPSIPDSDRTGYTVGYGWMGAQLGIDVYAMQMDFDDVTATGVPSDGVIPGTYESSTLLLGGTVKYRF